MAPPKRQLSSSPEKGEQRPAKERRVGDEIPEFVPSSPPATGIFAPDTTRFPTLLASIEHELGSGDGAVAAARAEGVDADVAPDIVTPVVHAIPHFVPSSPAAPGTFTPNIVHFPTLLASVEHEIRSADVATTNRGAKDERTSFAPDAEIPSDDSKTRQPVASSSPAPNASPPNAAGYPARRASMQHNRRSSEDAAATSTGAEGEDGKAAPVIETRDALEAVGTLEGFNPWNKQRELRRRTYPSRLRPMPFTKEKFEGKITVCVTSTLDGSVFGYEDAKALVEYIHMILYSLFCSEENLRVEDWKSVQDEFKPVLDTRRTLVRVFLEGFLDVKLRALTEKSISCGRTCVLSGRGLPETFEEIGLSIRGYIPKYDDKLRYEIVLDKDDPLFEVWYLFARDIYIRNIQPIQNHWPGYPPDEPEASHEEVRDMDLLEEVIGKVEDNGAPAQPPDAIAFGEEDLAMVTPSTPAPPVGVSGRIASEPATQPRRSERPRKVVKYTK